jgi:glutamate formiminotransferase/formiminotetrahydrofolate cyclodeaminase
MEAFRMPKEADADKKARSAAIEKATLRATESPLNVMRASFELFPLLEAMTKEGNPNSVSDAGVGVICAFAAIESAWLNVMINLSGIKDKEAAAAFRKEADELIAQARGAKDRIVEVVTKTIGKGQ